MGWSRELRRSEARMQMPPALERSPPTEERVRQAAFAIQQGRPNTHVLESHGAQSR